MQSWAAVWAPIRARLEARAEVFCHRDYHAENLIWLPDRPGAAAVGMLDFQDAVRATRAWDLMMLLQDARRDVSPALEAACLDRYLAAESQLDRAELMADYAAVSALNACRLIGLFTRLNVRDGKPRYTSFIPRVWAYQVRNLAAPGMEAVAAWFDRHVPLDTRA